MSIPCKLKFWGVRGSIASGPSHFGSNTSCVEFDFSDEMSLFCDAGTGIRAATSGRNFKELAVFISHFHWDHIQGFPFIERLGESKSKIKVLSAFEDVKERFSHLFDQRFHPVALQEYEKQIEFQILKSGETYEFNGVKLQVALLNHPGDSYALKLSGENSSVVYATDSDYDPVHPEASRLLKGSDWVICDSQYLIGDHLQKAHYGHASFQTAVEVCAEHQVKNCVLYHFDPNYSDEQLKDLEEQAKTFSSQKFSQLGPHVLMAHEGLSLDLRF